jgi:orotidine-5'-phosphate decarboxylase
MQNVRHFDSPKDRLIVALDGMPLHEAAVVAGELADHVGGFKVGLELLTRHGPAALVKIRSALGKDRSWPPFFYDGKFSDIPSTVGAASRAAAALRVWAFNVHAACGVMAMRAAVENKGDALVLAVTVLTSLDENDVGLIYHSSLTSQVIDMARLAAEAGVDGLICAPRDVPLLRDRHDLTGLLLVTPGVRPGWAKADDQNPDRLATPKGAIAAGADVLVVGRPITQPPASCGDRVQAAQMIVDEIAEGLAERRKALAARGSALCDRILDLASQIDEARNDHDT